MLSNESLAGADAHIAQLKMLWIHQRSIHTLLFFYLPLVKQFGLIYSRSLHCCCRRWWHRFRWRPRAYSRSYRHSYNFVGTAIYTENMDFIYLFTLLYAADWLSLTFPQSVQTPSAKLWLSTWWDLDICTVEVSSVKVLNKMVSVCRQVSGSRFPYTEPYA